MTERGDRHSRIHKRSSEAQGRQNQVHHAEHHHQVAGTHNEGSFPVGNSDWPSLAEIFRMCHKKRSTNPQSCSGTFSHAALICSSPLPLQHRVFLSPESRTSKNLTSLQLLQQLLARIWAYLHSLIQISRVSIVARIQPTRSLHYSYDRKSGKLILDCLQQLKQSKTVYMHEHGMI